MSQTSSRIPISISPFFFLTAALIGWLNSRGSANSFLLTSIWMIVIFVSILVHEFGHALALRLFGKHPRIELVAFGGITYHEEKRLRGWREFFVVLNGPLFGFLLFFITFFLLRSRGFQGPISIEMLQIFVWVNLFWTVINLLPVIPLDGGQLLRVICESISPTKGLKTALFISLLISIGLASFFFFTANFFIGIIFALFIFQNFNSWRQARLMTGEDQEESLSQEFQELQKLIASDDKEATIPRLEELRKKGGKGLIYHMATQYLASFQAEKGKFEEVYHLLIPIKEHLSLESKVSLHHAAFEMKDYPLVMDLSGIVFQHIPSAEVALYNAEAAAAMDRVEPTIGWLKAAHHSGVEDLTLVLARESFAQVKEDPRFKEFLNAL
jgi:stage IV sporulation protein FB